MTDFPVLTKYKRLQWLKIVPDHVDHQGVFTKWGPKLETGVYRRCGRVTRHDDGQSGIDAQISRKQYRRLRDFLLH
jgi:hypothetical protein